MHSVLGDFTIGERATEHSHNKACQLHRLVRAEISPVEDGMAILQVEATEVCWVVCVQVTLKPFISALRETCISIDPFAALNTGGWIQMQLM